MSTISLPVTIISLVGLGYFLVHARFAPDKVALLTLLFPFPFFVTALYLGQRPLHVEEVMGELYNVRFGLTMIIPAALFYGYLARRKIWLQVLLLLIIIATPF